MNSLVKHCPLPRTDAEAATAESIEAPGYMTPISGDGDLIQEDDCGNRDIHQYSSHARSSDDSVGDGTGTASLLDEALSAAMEAIADANRFNAASTNCDTETVSCSDVGTNHPPPISSITSSMESTDELESHLNLRSDSFFPGASNSFAFVKDMDHTVEKVQVDHGASENSKSKTDGVPRSLGTQDTKATNTLALISLGSSLGTLTSFFANWRPILRPLFERTLIERLWSFGELGATGPQPLLLSMWFIISRHFGVGCRTEHAKLVYGNVDIGTDPVTGQKQLQFFRTVRPLVDNQAPSSESPNSFRSSEPNIVVPEQPDKPGRCPVWLFQRFRAHRPFTVNFPSCPLYLQPERHASMNTPLMGTDNDIIWYTTNGLGKNKIGAMLNLALQNVGVPIVRQINLSRFCDALAAAVLTPAGGEVGARLGELVKMCKQSSDQEPLRQEMESCAERIVNQSTNPDSPIHQLLLRICSTKEKPKTQTRTARNTPKLHTNHDRKDGSVNGVAVHNFSIHSTQAIAAHHPPCDGNTNRPTDILVRSASDVVGSSASHLPPTIVLLPSVSGTHSSQSHTIANSPETLGLISSSVPMDENVIDISRLTNFDQLASVNLSSTSAATRTSEAQPMRENQFNNTVATTSYPLHPDPSDRSLFSTNEDLQIKTHKSGSETNRSIRLEMRDLLDLVLAAAKTSSIDSPDRVHNEIRRLQVVNTVQRPPVGLVTQLLWRARALDDRGPWILTFSMWWLMQHYFGIGTRMHHVRLCWGHLRLVSNVHDPMTGELCEAIEYVGPPEFTTLRACALVESCGDSLRVRRVYPSSGWAEAEITIAGALSAECASDRPRIRPLETTTDVPTIQARAGPNFVELYKAFARRRQRPSLRPEAPFYVQPLQTYPMMLNSRPDIVWYSVGALGKNRIGALMRNIVDKVVRPNLPRVAQAATSSARKACILATRRAAQALPALPSDLAYELDERRQLMLNKLSCILGLNSTTVMEQMSAKSVEPPSSPSDESPRSCWNTYSLLPTTSTSTACSNSTVLLPPSSLPSTTVAAQTNNAISVREFTLGLARGSLPQAIPQNTRLTASDLQHQLAGGTATSNVIWNPSSCFSSTPQSYPATGLVLLSSPDGKSTQLAAIQQQQQQQQPCTNRVFLLPTANGNAAVLSGPGLAVCVDRSLTNQTVQRYQKEPVLHPAQQQTILASVEGQLVKANNLAGITPRTGQTVAYLTQPQTNLNTCTMGTAPVRLVLLSTSNEDTRSASTLQPSFLVGGDSQVQPVPYSQPIKQENPVIATSTVDCLHITSPVNSQPNGGKTEVVTFPDRLGSLVSSSTLRPLNLPVCTQTVLQARNVTLPSEYAEQRFKPEQISPTGNMYDPPPPPIVIQAITPDGRVFNLSHASQVTSSEDIKPQFYDQVYEDPDPDEATAGELLSNYGQHRIANIGMPCLPEVTSFSATSDRSVHGVFPISSTASRVANSPSTQSSVSSVVIHSERQPIPAESTSTLMSSDEIPVSKVALAKKGASSDKPVGRASGTDTRTCAYLPIVSELTYSLPIPEPSPDNLRTLQEAINSARAFQCGDFPSYVEKLFRRGILSANQPFLLNFCAWFINSVAFEVENRSEHGNLRWGDFQLGKTADGLTEFLYFVNPVTNKSYYLAAGPDSSYKLGVSEELAPLDNEPLPVCCPCPVAIFKALRDHRPLSCRYLHAKFYLQPLTRQELANASIRQGSSSAVMDWFTERPWGKNKLGSLFGEAARLAGLPVIYLRKNRIQSNPHTTMPGVIASTASNASVVQSPLSFGDSPTVSTLPNYLPSLLESASGSGESPQTELKRRRISHSPTNEHSALSPNTTGIASLPSSSTILRANKSTAVS